MIFEIDYPQGQESEAQARYVAFLAEVVLVVVSFCM
jgi:hypothetical protein